MIGSGQSRWDEEWSGRDVMHDIGMRDYFNGRQYILKFFPWWGKALEAGCGLGRYVFYFNALGREIVGMDFSAESIRKAIRFAKKHGFEEGLFVQGDMEHLGFEEGTFSYCLSLGVLEHIFQGPERALAEAFRVLAPGGVLLVTTPNKFSLSLLQRLLRRNLKRALRPTGLRGRTRSMTLNPDGSFFQYWYSPAEIGSFIRNAGFHIIKQDRIDLHFPVVHRAATSFVDRWLFAHQTLLNRLENTPLKAFGANTVTIAIKPAELMHCFCCGEIKSREELLKKSNETPVCISCRSSHANVLQALHTRTRSTYSTDSEDLSGCKCAYCGQMFQPHPVFGTFGLSKAVCPSCVRKPRIFGELSILHVKQTWKPYSGD
jgi:SAM-dependent methyltransferase